jgi:hypothetical protein
VATTGSAVSQSLQGDFPETAEVAVVGAGLAGLACARVLQQRGMDVVVLESASRVGGRVATDTVDGFLCDRGFQVLLTGYPAARRWLDMEALSLRSFPAGALIRHGQSWVKLGDPLRHPGDLMATLTCPVGSFSDKLRVGFLRLALAAGWPLCTQGSTQDLLTRWGFSREFIERFFRPFFGGVFLERELSTLAAKFAYLFHLFSSSRVTVPARGMGAIPQQLAEPLSGQVWLNTPFQGLDGTLLSTPRGQLLAKNVVLAGAAQEAVLGGPITPFQRTQTHYFTTSNWPWGDHLMLGQPGSVIVTLAPLRAYSRDGQTLLAASVVAPQASLEPGHAAASLQLESWFPDLKFRHLASYDIPLALPVEETDLQRSPRLGEHFFACGDHRQSGSIQGALESGEQAASAIIDL